MQRLLLTLVLALPLAVSAQSGYWEYDSNFPAAEDRQFSSTHGLAVDGEGLIWVQPFGTVDSVQVAGEYLSSGTVTVFSPDGTEAACSPVRFLSDASGAVTDTLGIATNASGNLETQTGRGLRADVNGDVLITQGNLLFKVDHTSCGAGAAPNTVRLLAKAQPFSGSMISAGTDNAGNFYISQVVGQGALGYKILGPDLSDLGDFGNNRSFNRATLAVDDGGGDGGVAVWDFSYTTLMPSVWYRPDDFSDFDSLGVTPMGMAIESAAIQPVTDYLWFSAGSPLDAPAPGTPWQINTWYGFAMEDLFVFDGNGDITATIEMPTPRDSITWNEEASEGRPRALAFSADGETAYVGQFNQGAPATQKFIKLGVASEGTPEWVAVVDVFQNTPNPVSDRTTIEFTTREAGTVRIRVFDATGRQVATVADRAFATGTHSVDFDASALSAGVYIYSVEVNGFGTSRQMTVVR
ncbi:MAG: T9SS C-terminal target domain-containing protein [Rhodothermaceae bacterium]|uniref:T9SS type A sorting domain-containing protein n=1 Tax=Rubrivirga sp. SAORIC476 TaxID=1961794 RepID=UPI000BA9401E|nr:T9SS type A sorting domain-containing protein [Rubrivirga sp. SAORIC476]MAQ92045.1 T9SS C-terminal target domain-containing protein [Rhodothermaceae bacterium]MBC14383.1 T9SS C-terminal target domain-containing protein [Rhodothermaceae bacterium]